MRIWQQVLAGILVTGCGFLMAAPPPVRVGGGNTISAEYRAELIKRRALAEATYRNWAAATAKAPPTTASTRPVLRFFRINTESRRVVYVIKHSGSMMDNFDFLREEVKWSVRRLSPSQEFNVVMWEETADVIFDKDRLVKATQDNIQTLAKRIAEFVPQGQNDDIYDPLKQAFDEAFKMKPDTIIFVADGHFDPKLAEFVAQTNKKLKISIHTVAFVNKEPSYEERLRDLAKDNGGHYTFVSEEDFDALAAQFAPSATAPGSQPATTTAPSSAPAASAEKE